MRIVIDIPEALYDRVNQLDYTADMYDFADSMYQADIKNLAFAVKNGTLLPKNHGKLKDTDALKLRLTRPIFDDYEQEVIWKAIDSAPTIIEAE